MAIVCCNTPCQHFTYKIQLPQKSSNEEACRGYILYEQMTKLNEIEIEFEFDQMQLNAKEAVIEKIERWKDSCNTTES